MAVSFQRPARGVWWAYPSFPLKISQKLPSDSNPRKRLVFISELMMAFGHESIAETYLPVPSNPAGLSLPRPEAEPPAGTVIHVSFSPGMCGGPAPAWLSEIHCHWSYLLQAWAHWLFKARLWLPPSSLIPAGERSLQGSRGARSQQCWRHRLFLHGSH